VSFSGFDAAALAQLSDLPDWSVDEYSAHKSVLGTGLIDPARDLIVDLAGRLDADLTVVSRSSVSPLHRDLRFAAAGSPRYKDHLLLATWEGADKKLSPVLWVRIDADRVGFASGIAFAPAIRERWRTQVAGTPGEMLAGLIDTLEVEHDAVVAGDRLKRVPAPFDADHPRADLLRRTGFQIRFVEPIPSCVSRPEFAVWCSERLGALLPVHRWLVDNLSTDS
jgi:uncharacterized protein (DUF2461 family)